MNKCSSISFCTEFKTQKYEFIEYASYFFFSLPNALFAASKDESEEK